MYVTRPLSMYRRSPSSLEIPPPDAPYSGYLVITDEEAEAEDTCCWRLCRRKRVKKLPFPQDKIFSVSHASEYEQTSNTKVWFLPVPDHPLSSNRYYVIRAKGRHKGKAYKCSREGDIVSCCFTDLLNDKRPKPFNLKDLNQIFKIHSHQSGGFFARSITPDGIPPKFLRKKGWRVRISGSYRSCRITEALGVDSTLREKLPDFNFPISRKRSPPLVVGKWYCPFIFVKEGTTRVKHQMKKSMFYKMTLEQKWEEVYSCVNDHESGEGDGNVAVVVVNVCVEREVVLVSGMEATKNNGKGDANGFLWYRACNPYNRRRVNVGLSLAIVEHMRWVQEQGGWAYGNGREKVVRMRAGMEAKTDYTQDGTVDFRGQPALPSKTGKWKACAFLVGYEAFERMAFYGVASNLVNYLTTQLHEDTVSSVRNVNNWSGSVWITPILGAYIADSYLGRFWTFTLSSLIYVLGMTLLTIAVSLKSLRPACTNGICNKASSSQIAFFYTALYTMAIGAGGTKPNISTFGADQFDDFNPNEKELKASFFNWWMFTSFLGALIATLGLVYIQENLGWGLGYGIPTAGLLLSLVIFYIGTPIYRHKVRTTKSPASDLIRVPIAAFKNRKLQLPSSPSDLFEHQLQHYVSSGKRQVYHTPALRFLDKAAIKEDTTTGSSRVPMTVTQVEGAKLIFGMVLIWLVTLIPSTIWAQINTLFVKQGTTLERNLGPDFKIPAASLGSFVTLSMLLSVPMYDRLFVPFMRQKTGHPRGITLLQRLGIGFSIQIIAIAIAYAVEVRRMHVIKASHIVSPKEIVPMSIFWLLPQYVLIGIADVFNAIGLLEFFYDQSPDDMQSLGTTFFTSGIGVGNFLNSFLVTMVDKITGMGERKSWIGDNLNDCHLDYYYGFLLVMSSVNLLVFLWASSRYIYKRESIRVKEGALCVQMEGNPTLDASLGLQV